MAIAAADRTTCAKSCVKCTTCKKCAKSCSCRSVATAGIMTAVLALCMNFFASVSAQEDHEHHDHAHAHGPPCVCEAEDFGWAIDCTNVEPVADAINFLLDSANGCSFEDAEENVDCVENYHLMQAHHDFCPHHALDSVVVDGYGGVETLIHSFEQLYDDCMIGRMYDPELAMCPEVSCSDEDAMMAAVATITSDACANACVDDCEMAFQTILHVHDVCDEDEIPTVLEETLHDFEELCEEHLCNSVTEEQGMALLDTSMCSEINEYEWGGIFELPEDSYTWIAQKTGSGDDMAYADPTMKLAVLPAMDGSEEALEALGEEGNHALEEECTDVLPGGTIPVAMDACVRIVFDQNATETHFTISAPTEQFVAIFAEHFPTEFENDRHYLSDASGVDVEPLMSLNDGGHDDHEDEHEDEHDDHEDEHEDEHDDHEDEHEDEHDDHEHHEHHEPCFCVAQEENWEINCANATDVEISAYGYLLDASNGCALTDSGMNAECLRQYHIVQAHHDHCPHDTVYSDIESGLHLFEDLYEDCAISRAYDPELSSCPVPDCSDSAGMSAAVATLRSEPCTTSCSDESCVVAFQLILSAHDSCPEDMVSYAVEETLHDFEELCEESLCNSIGPDYDITLTECEDHAGESDNGDHDDHDDHEGEEHDDP